MSKIYIFFAVIASLLSLSVSAGQEIDVNVEDLSVATDFENILDPRAPKQMHALEFLLGSWELTSTTTMADGSQQLFRGRLIGSVGMGGFAIQTVSIHPPFSAEDFSLFVGTHILTFHPKTERIVGVAINSIGNRKIIDGEVLGDEVSIVASGEMFDGGTFKNRTVYFNISSDSFETRSEVSSDGGKTWHNANYSANAKKSRNPY